MYVHVRLGTGGATMDGDPNILYISGSSVLVFYDMEATHTGGCTSKVLFFWVWGLR